MYCAVMKSSTTIAFEPSTVKYRLYGYGTLIVPIGLAVSWFTTVSLEPPMLLTYSRERSQSGVMCSGFRDTAKRPTILKVLGSMTVTSPDSSLGT